MAYLVEIECDAEGCRHNVAHNKVCGRDLTDVGFLKISKEGRCEFFEPVQD